MELLNRSSSRNLSASSLSALARKRFASAFLAGALALGVAGCHSLPPAISRGGKNWYQSRELTNLDGVYPALFDTVLIVTRIHPSIDRRMANIHPVLKELGLSRLSYPYLTTIVRPSFSTLFYSYIYMDSVNGGIIASFAKDPSHRGDEIKLSAFKSPLPITLTDTSIVLNRGHFVLSAGGRYLLLFRGMEQYQLDLSKEFGALPTRLKLSQAGDDLLVTTDIATRTYSMRTLFHEPPSWADTAACSWSIFGKNIAAIEFQDSTGQKTAVPFFTGDSTLYFISKSGTYGAEISGYLQEAGLKSLSDTNRFVVVKPVFDPRLFAYLPLRDTKTALIFAFDDPSMPKNSKFQSIRVKAHASFSEEDSWIILPNGCFVRVLENRYLAVFKGEDMLELDLNQEFSRSLKSAYVDQFGDDLLVVGDSVRYVYSQADIMDLFKK